MSCSVLGGMGKYFNVDPTLLRIIFMVNLIVSVNFALIFLYIAAIFVIPNEL